MRIQGISLKNIGPFKLESLVFINEDEDDFLRPPVIMFTGENGTGKTIILDSIRAIFFGHFSGRMERSIVSNPQDFSIKINLAFPDHKYFVVESTGNLFDNDRSIDTTNGPLSKHIAHSLVLTNNWILDYWTSRLSVDSFKIDNISQLDVSDYLKNSLTGMHSNFDLTKVICFFDYLQSSEDQYEAKEGKVLMGILTKIISSSLNKGEFSHVARRTLSPILKIHNKEITLEKLSSGNLYLIQRLVSLLAKMYCVHRINNSPIENVCNNAGLLLIDEAENHLHPKWQKKFLSTILDIFPNLQIILTTHSPFIISSIETSRIFVCKSKDDYSIIDEETGNYTNKPIEEILRTPLFSTDSFNLEIENLIKRRKSLIQQNDLEAAREIERQLLEINPDYFRYFKIGEI